MKSANARPASDPDAEIAELGPWFHNLHLPDGRQTAPEHRFGDFPREKWLELKPHLPASLEGMRALDIGCNAGFYSFALAEMGAEVVGIDDDPHYLRQAEWAAERYGARNVTFRRQQVYDLARNDERFDLILFMGVFYHLRYPLLALDILTRLEPATLVFQSLTADVGPTPTAPREPLDFDSRDLLTAREWPFMAFIEGYFAGDPTNWWAPNDAAVHALLRSAGFRVASRPGHELYLCRPDPSFTPCPTNDRQLAAATGRARAQDRAEDHEEET